MWWLFEQALPSVSLVYRDTMASMRIVQTVIGRCHCTVLAHSVIPTLHPSLQPTVATNRINRHLSVWSTARLSSSVAATQPSPAPLTLECSTDGKKLKVSWPGGEHSYYHSLWLRHNCSCSMCWDATTDQRKVRPPDLAGGPIIHTTEVCGSPYDSSKLNISWSYSNGSQHQGEIDLKWLRENSYSPTSLRERQQHSVPPVTRTLPQTSYSDVLKGEEGVWKVVTMVADKLKPQWFILHKTTREWLRHLNEYGVCLLTDVQNVGTLKRSWKVQDCFLQRACMDWNDACVEGGESVLLDAFAVVEEVRKKHPQHFATLTRVPTTFQRIHSKRDSPASYRYQRPHILLDKSSNVTAIFWTPANEGPLFIPEEDVESYYEAYICLERMFTESDRKISIFTADCLRHQLHTLTLATTDFNCMKNCRLTHRLKPGEAMTFNNRRFLHSRNAFKLNGGIRHLQGIYVNTDDFKSRVQVLASKFSPNYEVKTVFNQDSIYN